MKKKTKTVYMADDGTEHEDEVACLEHEAYIAAWEDIHAFVNNRVVSEEGSKGAKRKRSEYVNLLSAWEAHKRAGGAVTIEEAKK